MGLRSGCGMEIIMALTQDYKRELKVKAAYYHYKKDMKLADIADTLNISRVTLNKLLKEALDEGIVRIEIIDRDNTIGILELEESVKERILLLFSRLREAITMWRMRPQGWWTA